mgnify:CR=1 FL=1
MSWGATVVLATVLAFGSNILWDWRAYYPILALSLGLGVFAEPLRQREQRPKAKRLREEYRAAR